MPADSLKRSLSLIPNLHSGIPDNCDFMMTWPMTSDFRTVPLFESNTFTFSMMSMNNSLNRYFIPSALHEIDPVAYIVICFNFSMFVSSLVTLP